MARAATCLAFVVIGTGAGAMLGLLLTVTPWGPGDAGWRGTLVSVSVVVGFTLGWWAAVAIGLGWTCDEGHLRCLEATPANDDRWTDTSESDVRGGHP